MAQWPKTDKWGGKCIRENTALRTKFRAGVRVQAVWIEFAFGPLGVMTTQASWLVQMGRGVLIGQRACWLLTLAQESIDSPRTKSDRFHSCRDKQQLALSTWPSAAWPIRTRNLMWVSLIGCLAWIFNQGAGFMMSNIELHPVFMCKLTGLPFCPRWKVLERSLWRSCYTLWILRKFFTLVLIWHSLTTPEAEFFLHKIELTSWLASLSDEIVDPRWTKLKLPSRRYHLLCLLQGRRFRSNTVYYFKSNWKKFISECSFVTAYVGLFFTCCYSSSPSSPE